MKTDGSSKAVHLAAELQREMDAKLAELKATQTSAQNQMNSILESFKAFQPLITKAQVEEQSFVFQARLIHELRRKILEQEDLLVGKEAEARDLTLGLAEARAHRDELRADQEAKGTEISGLKTDLDSTKDSLRGMDARLAQVRQELATKEEEMKANSAEIRRLQGLLDAAKDESWKLLDAQKNEKEAWSRERGELKTKVAEVEERIRLLRQQLGDLDATYKKLQEEMLLKSEILSSSQADLQRATAERDSNAQALKEAEARQKAIANEFDEMKRMCGAMEDGWGEERAKLVEELATSSAQLQEVRNDLKTCNERLKTSIAEAELLTHLKDLIKDDAGRQAAKSRLAIQRIQLRNSARIYVADYYRKMAESATEAASEAAHREKARHAAEERALRAELSEAKRKAMENQARLTKLHFEKLKQRQLAMLARFNGTDDYTHPDLPPEGEPVPPGVYEPVPGTEAAARREAKANGPPSPLLSKPLNGVANGKHQTHPPATKSEIDAMRKANKELMTERDTLSRKLDQTTRDGLSERSQLLQALQAAKAEADGLRRENKMNAAQVEAQNERVAMLEKELVDLKKSDAYTALAPNHAATAMRFRELEERSREAERRLRDAVEENVDLRERIESCEELEMALRAAKEMLKSAELRVREAVEENSELRKRLYKW